VSSLSFILLVGVEVVDKGANGRVHFSTLVHHLAHLFVAVHHGCVVFVAEEGTNLFPAIAENFSGDIDGNVASLSDVSFSGDADNFFAFDSVMLADAVEDLFERWFCNDEVGVVAFDNFVCEVDIDGLSGETGLGGHFVKGSFQVADGAVDAFSEGHSGFLVEVDSFDVGSLEKDRALGFSVGVLDIDNESRFES